MFLTLTLRITTFSFIFTLLVLILCSFATTTAHGRILSDANTTRPAPYSGRSTAEDPDYLRHSLYLPMQDGIKLAITVYRPVDHDRRQRHPTIIHQTRYWRSIEYVWPLSLFKEEQTRGVMGPFAKRFLANGYAWVDVDVRGSGASFGSRPYAHAPREILDGSEIVEWIIQQPWSNGKVGAIGMSYGGAAAEFLLVNKHPAVKAVAPLFSSFDLYPDIAFPGGVHLSWFTKTWTYINKQLDHNRLPFSNWMTRAFVHGVTPVTMDHDRSLLMQAIQEHHANWSPHKEARMLTFRDDVPSSSSVPIIDRLSTKTYANVIGSSGAAIYSYSGWFDGGYQMAAIKRHLAHANHANKLILGPWDHGGKRNISPFNLGPSQFDHQGELLKFFDYHVQNLDTGIQREAPVHYFTMGEERWKATDTWPPHAARVLQYFSSDHQLTQNVPVQPTASDRYPVDPSVGSGHQSRWNTLVGKPLPTPYADRAHTSEQLLSYTSAPLTQPMEVTGHPTVTIYVSSTTTDATIFAYLEDIDSTDKVTYVTEGLLRALHRQEVAPPEHYPEGVPYRTFTRENAAPLIPHQVAQLSFALLPTSYQFKQGHRIRLSIAGADKDHFAVLPGENPTFTIYRSAQYPSHLDLPVVQ